MLAKLPTKTRSQIPSFINLYFYNLDNSRRYIQVGNHHPNFHAASYYYFNFKVFDQALAYSNILRPRILCSIFIAKARLMIPTEFVDNMKELIWALP